MHCVLEKSILLKLEKCSMYEAQVYLLGGSVKNRANYNENLQAFVATSTRNHQIIPI